MTTLGGLTPVPSIFGLGVPAMVIAQDGVRYFDTTTAPYKEYVSAGGAWIGPLGSGGGNISGSLAVTGNISATGTIAGTGTVSGGNLTTAAALTVPGAAVAAITSAVTFTTGAGVGAGTLTNAPAAGDPTKWIKVNDAGVTRYIPAW